MELSSRDKRILAEIECESAIEDPRWVRRFERLGRGRRWRVWRVWRRIGYALAVACWVALLTMGAATGRDILLRVAIEAVPVAIGASLVILIMHRTRRTGPRRTGAGRTRRWWGQRIAKERRARGGRWSYPGPDES